MTNHSPDPRWVDTDPAPGNVGRLVLRTDPTVTVPAHVVWRGNDGIPSPHEERVGFTATASSTWVTWVSLADWVFRMPAPPIPTTPGWYLVDAGESDSVSGSIAIELLGTGEWVDNTDSRYLTGEWVAARKSFQRLIPMLPLDPPEPDAYWLDEKVWVRARDRRKPSYSEAWDRAVSRVAGL